MAWKDYQYGSRAAIEITIFYWFPWSSLPFLFIFERIWALKNYVCEIYVHLIVEWLKVREADEGLIKTRNKKDDLFFVWKIRING